jgi:hypothetical protein
VTQPSDGRSRAGASRRLFVRLGRPSRLTLLGGWVVASILFFGAVSAQALPEPPYLEGLSISPTTVNTTTSSQSISVTAHVVDGGPGVREVRVRLASPKGNQRVEAPLLRVSGTTTNGMYTATPVLPQGSAPGTWTVEVEMYDVQGNVRQLGPAKLEARGLPGTINVESVATSTTPPYLEGLSISPTTVNTSSSSQNISATAHVVDGGPGVREVRVRLASPKGSQRVEDPLPRVSGTTTNGMYTATLVLPQGSAPGAWTVEAEMYDVQGIGRDIGPAKLEARGLPGTINVESVATSTIPPHLDRLSISPTTVNTSSSSQNISVTAHVLDNGPGVREVRVRLASPNGSQRIEDPLLRVSGTTTNGMYTATLVLPQGSAPGTWTVEVEMYDVQGVSAQLGPAKLEARGYPGTINVE